MNMGDEGENEEPALTQTEDAVQSDLTTPFFLRAQQPDTNPSVMPEPQEPNYRRPDTANGETWMSIKLTGPISAIHKEIARQLYLGRTAREIASSINMSHDYIGQIRSHPKILAEVDKLTNMTWERTIDQRLKDTAPYAMDVIEGILTTDDPKVRPGLKKETAVWVLEKLTGRPRQDIDVQSGTLNTFLGLLENIQSGRGTIDITDSKTLSPAADYPMSTDALTEEAGAQGPLPPAAAVPEPPRESEAERWVRENLP